MNESKACGGRPSRSPASSSPSSHLRHPSSPVPSHADECLAHGARHASAGRHALRQDGPRDGRQAHGRHNRSQGPSARRGAFSSPNPNPRHFQHIRARPRPCCPVLTPSIASPTCSFVQSRLRFGSRCTCALRWTASSKIRTSRSCSRRASCRSWPASRSTSCTRRSAKRRAISSHSSANSTDSVRADSSR